MIKAFQQDWQPAYLIACALLLGGASAAGVWANALLMLLALLSLALSLMTGGWPVVPRQVRWLVLLVAALTLVQLIPLPPPIWAALPERKAIAEGFDLLGVSRPWLPISLDQEATLGAALSLLVPAAVLLSASAASRVGIVRALCVIAGGASLSLMLGIVQMAQGEASGLYPYAFTNRGMAVGLFANRNHLATLLLCALPALAVVSQPWRHGAAFRAAGFFTFALGLVVVGSDAGLILLIPALAAAIALGRGQRTLSLRGARLAALSAVIVAATAAAGLLALRDLNEAGGAELHRPHIIATTLIAAADYLPFGSGGGTLRRIYPRYEDPAGVASDYTSHAHSDYAEVLLEYGGLGAVAIMAVLAWLVCRIRTAWLEPHGDMVSRGGTVILGLLLVHSLVDYPLRTAAIAAVAGLAAAMASRRWDADLAPPPEDRPDHIRISL